MEGQEKPVERSYDDEENLIYDLTMEMIKEENLIYDLTMEMIKELRDWARECGRKRLAELLEKIINTQ